MFKILGLVVFDGMCFDWVGMVEGDVLQSILENCYVFVYIIVVVMGRVIGWGLLKLNLLMFWLFNGIYCKNFLDSVVDCCCNWFVFGWYYVGEWIEDC